jgi:hypothetical protein
MPSLLLPGPLLTQPTRPAQDPTTASWFDPDVKEFVDKIYLKSGLGAPPPCLPCLAAAWRLAG